MAGNRARIAVDAMGGDHAPEQIVAGAIRASEELDVDVLLVGDRPSIQASLQHHTQSPKIEIVDADGAIAMDEGITGLRRKPKASINVAMDLSQEK
jgi:glycerol-3-phosphate acyltransferase PlsX